MRVHFDLDTTNPGDCVVLDKFLGALAPKPKEQAPDVVVVPFDFQVAADAFKAAVVKHISASLQAQMAAAVAAARPFLPGPLPISDVEARELAEHAFMSNPSARPGQSAMAAVKALAARCLPQRAPVAPASTAS